MIGGGAAVSSASYLFESATVHGAADAGEQLISLNVNGQVHKVADVMQQETLAWTLRYKLGLTGTKLGCEPHYSCSVLTHTVRDRKVLTIEGWRVRMERCIRCSRGSLRNCPFCMSGFAVAAVGLLKTNPDPTRTELAQGISGSLCRCQDYDKILTSLMSGAEKMRNAHV